MGRLLAFVLAFLAMTSSLPAEADYTTTSPVRPLTMSDPSGLTVIGGDVQYTQWTERPPGLEVDVTSLTFDLGADIRLAPHWMLLARLPLSYASVEGSPGLDGCCDLALGNLTIGGRGLWSSRPANAMIVTGVELSLSAPTAPDSGDGAVSASAAAVAHLPRDPGLYAPNATTLRLTIPAQLYMRRLLVHGEAGVQLFFLDNDAGGGSNVDAAFRLGLAAGVRATYKVAILAELNSLVDAESTGGDSPTSLDFGVRYASERGTFGLRVYVPIDKELRDLDMFGIGFNAGLRL